MLTKTSTFCQIMPEKNQFKETYPLKKRKKTQKFVHFKNLYPLLLRLCRPQEVTPKLMTHILINGPHLMSPQQGLEVSQTHILRAISCYFRTVIMKDPVYTFSQMSSNHIIEFSQNHITVKGEEDTYSFNFLWPVERNR